MSPQSQHIASLVDLTLLNLSAEPSVFEPLNKQAELAKVAAFCVYPEHLPLLTAPPSIIRATVLNFPLGESSLDVLIAKLEQIVMQNLAQEIDYVFPYEDYLNSKQEQALRDTQKIIQFCHQHDLKIKIILETECFPNSKAIYDLSLKLIEQGCDFLKTSTGTKPIGATLSAAEAILDAIKATSSCGLKVSGGIKTINDALAYIELAETKLNRKTDASWFRIGASQLIAQLLGPYMDSTPSTLPE